MKIFRCDICEEVFAKDMPHYKVGIKADLVEGALPFQKCEERIEVILDEVCKDCINMMRKSK